MKEYAHSYLNSASGLRLVRAGFASDTRRCRIGVALLPSDAYTDQLDAEIISPHFEAPGEAV